MVEYYFRVLNVFFNDLIASSPVKAHWTGEFNILQIIYRNILINVFLNYDSFNDYEHNKDNHGKSNEYLVLY